MTDELGIIETIIKTLGAPGIIVICMGAPSLVMAFLYADHRRYERERLEAVRNEGLKEAQYREDKARNEAQHREEMAAGKEQFMVIITAQEKRFEQVAGFYEKNVYLVENYAKLANDLADIIHLNTQMMTRLVEKIENNLFCPIVKEGGPKHGL